MISTPLRYVRRNFILFYLDYVIFSGAIAMIGASTVVPDFVGHITNSTFIIGFSGSLFNFFWLVPQLFMAQQVNRSTNRMAIMRRWVLPVRTFFLMLAAIIAVTNNASVILIAFLVLYGLFAVGDGLITLLWADMLGSTLPHRLRSTLYMVAQFTVAFAVLGSREVVRHFLAADGPPFPKNYMWLFAIAGVTFLAAGICLWLLKEEKPETPLKAGPTFREFIPMLSEILRVDKDFRHFIQTRVLLDLATLALPFYVIFGETALNMNSETVVGDSILFLTAGSAIGALLLGWLSRRYGPRAVIRVASCGVLLHPLLALCSVFIGVNALYTLFLVLGIVNSSGAPGYFDWVIAHAPPERRPIYFGLTNTISAVSNLTPVVGGAILGVLLSLMAATSAYMALFIIAIVMAILGLLSTLGLRAPRQKDEVEAFTGAVVAAD